MLLARTRGIPTVVVVVVGHGVMGHMPIMMTVLLI